jgi:hypothetical protein
MSTLVGMRSQYDDAVWDNMDPELRQQATDLAQLRKNVDTESKFAEIFRQDYYEPERKRLQELENTQQGIDDWYDDWEHERNPDKNKLRGYLEDLGWAKDSIDQALEWPDAHKDGIQGSAELRVSEQEDLFEGTAEGQEELDNDVEDAKEELEDKTGDIMTEQAYKDLFRSDDGWANWGTVIGIGRSFRSFSSYMLPETYLWKEGAIRFFGDFIGVVEWIDVFGKLEDEICYQSVDFEYETPTTVSGIWGHQPAMHIEAQRTQPYDSGAGQVYDYYVTGAILPKKEGLKYKVVLKGSSGLSHTLAEGELSGDIIEAAWTGSNPLILEESALKYTKVCIDLNGNDPLILYFDNPPSSTNFCNQVKEVGEN